MEASRLILSAFLALGVASSTAWAVNFETNPGDPGNTVTFKITAPLETIVGTSAAVAARTNSYSKTPEHKTSPRIDRRRGRRRTYLLQTLSTKERQPRSTPSSRDART